MRTLLIEGDGRIGSGLEALGLSVNAIVLWNTICDGDVHSLLH